MSVLVRDMAMPSECEYCGFCRYYPQNGNVWCNAKNKLLKERWINPNWTHLDVKKPEWCPLVEVPTPHGRLVEFIDVVVTDDEDTGTQEINLGEALSAYLKMRITPTVIEAEGEE